MRFARRVHAYALPIATLAWLLVAGCGVGQNANNPLVIGLEGEVERLDPLTIKNPQTFVLSWQIFEGLLGLDDTGRVVPMLAERWETQDHLKWTFHLRKTVNFHRSEIFGAKDATRPVKAADVLWSYTAFCSPAAYSSFLLVDSVKGCAEYNAKKATIVEGFRTPNEWTFEITLVKPEPFFINRLTTAWISVFPRESDQPAVKEGWGLRTVVGTGPYRLESRTDSETILVRNEAYWGGMPAVERLVYRVLKNDQVRFSELAAGRIDLMTLPTALFPAVLEADGSPKTSYAEKYRLTAVTTFNSHMVGLNLNKIGDVHLRRAMFYGTDRRVIVMRLLYGYGDPTPGTIPPGIGGYVPPFEGDVYNPERARAELKESRYRGEPLELLVHEAANSEAVGQTFQAQMKTLGINVQLTKLDMNSVIGRIVKGEAPLFSMFFEYVFSAPEPVLVNMFTSAKIPVPNFWHFSDPAVDRAIEDLRLITDRAESVRRSAGIERMVMEQAPAIFLYRQKYLVLYARRFDGLRVNGHGHYELRALKPAA